MDGLGEELLAHAALAAQQDGDVLVEHPTGLGDDPVQRPVAGIELGQGIVCRRRLGSADHDASATSLETRIERIALRIVEQHRSIAARQGSGATEEPFQRHHAKFLGS